MGAIFALFISLSWSTFVGISGLSDERIWNSFFLQYLWEFVLGMQLAVYYKNNSNRFEIPSLKILIPISIVGIILTGITGGIGGILKAYNDIPSLAGYMGIALILYKLGLSSVNKFCSFTNKVSYEWYLVHILIFACSNHFMDYFFNVSPVINATIALVLSYLAAVVYHKILRELKVV